MERIYRINNITNNRKNAFNIQYGTRGIRGSLYLVNSLYLFPIRYYSDNSKLVTSEKQICKEKKAEIYKKGFPAIFQDMSKMKQRDYFAITKSIVKPLALVSLKGVPGIYMITNKVTKKFYIGMSTNLYSRFYNYLDIKRLIENGSSRINKALLKHGFENFSITILELPGLSDTNEKYLNSKVSTLKGYEAKSEYLRNREAFFIKVFKPQYNIKRSLASRDGDFFNHKYKVKREIPLKIKNLLDKCLDINSLGYNLSSFGFHKKKRFYWFNAMTPKGNIRAWSSGWFEGKIQSSEGFKLLETNIVPIKKIIGLYECEQIDRKVLAEFYTDKGKLYVANCLNSKIKALNVELKKKEVSKEEK